MQSGFCALAVLVPRWILLLCAQIFRWEPELDETAALQYLCRDAPLCPVLTSCSLEQGHFDDESHRSRSGAPPSRFVRPWSE